MHRFGSLHRRQVEVSPYVDFSAGMTFIYEGAVSSGAVGGARDHFLGLAKALQRSGTKRLVLVVPAFRGEPPLEFNVPSSCTIYRVPALRRGLLGHASYELVKLGPMLWLRLRDLLGGRHTTVLARITPVGVVPQIMALTRATVVVELNGLPDSEFARRGFGPGVVAAVRLVTNAQLRMATGVVAVTQRLAELAGGRTRARLLRLENGVDLEGLPIDRAEEGDRRTVAYSGAFAPWQELDVLVTAFAELVHGDPLSDWRLLLIGDGETRAAIEKLVHELEIRDRVEVTGWLSRYHAASRLLAARIAVVPLRPKDDTGVCGSPLKMFEYLALGRCVVASDIDGVVELEYPILRYRQGDPVDLARVLRVAAETHMDQPAIEALRQRLTWDDRASRLLAFLDAAEPFR